MTAATELTPHFQDYNWGITCIDTALFRPGLAACYLIEHQGMAAFIDAGTGNSVPLLLEVLRRKHINLDQVAYVMPTHVHLDHAGGVGGLMQALPKARLLVHPRGARHLIDPSKLQAGSLAVYGRERYEKTFGQLQAVDPARVVEMHDAETLDFNGRTLAFYDTPGHARHHYCIHDSLSNGVFTGDTFGVSYPELNGGRRRFIFPPTTPVQFDPAAWHASLDRLMALSPARVFVTHYGMHEDLPALAADLHTAIAEYAALAEEYAQEPDKQARIEQALLEDSTNRLLDAGCGLPVERIHELLKGDMNLNAQGLAHWLDVKASNAAGSGAGS